MQSESLNACICIQKLHLNWNLNSHLTDNDYDLKDGRGGWLTLSEPLAFYIFFLCVCVHKNAKRVSQKPFDLIISVYLSLLPVAHLSDAPRRRLVVTGDSARIQDETTENSAWFFNVLGV